VSVGAAKSDNSMGIKVDSSAPARSKMQDVPGSLRRISTGGCTVPAPSAAQLRVSEEGDKSCHGLLT